MSTLYYNHWFPLSPDVQVISKRTHIDAISFWGMQKILKHKSVFVYLSMLNKMDNIVPMCDLNVATLAPTAYLASWKNLGGATPFYHMQHFETIFFNDIQMKKFTSDTYFLPIYKISNCSWLRDKLFELTGNKSKVVNPAVEHNLFYPRLNETKEDSNARRTINIVALGKGGWKNAKGIYDAVQKVRINDSKTKIVLHYFGHTPPNFVLFDGVLNIFHKDLSDNELALLYSNSDIQVTFSTAESFPLPPLEAMACGASVITTPIGTEDYAISEENSLIVEPNNIDMLAEKIKTLIDNEDLRNKLRKNGIKTANRFNYRDQTKILESEMKTALNENVGKFQSKIL